jgi:predicted  nucleic acid-binding Zn-ribbon protein
MAIDVEAEIRDLKRRVGELEGSFGFLTRQVQNVHRDLLSFEEKTEGKLREHDGRFDRVDAKIDALDRKIDAKVDGLASALPGIIIDALREDRQRDRKR